MDWKKLLESITTPVDAELRLRNAYLIAENRILRQQVRGRVQLTHSDRQALAELGMQLGKPRSIGFSGGQLSSDVEGSSALDFPLIHDAWLQDQHKIKPTISIG